MNILKFLTKLILSAPLLGSLFPSHPPRKPAFPSFVRKVGNTLHYFENYRLSRVPSTAVHVVRDHVIRPYQRGCGCLTPSPRSKLSHSSLLICETCHHIRPFSSIISTFLLTYSKNILYLKSSRIDF